MGAAFVDLTLELLQRKGLSHKVAIQITRDWIDTSPPDLPVDLLLPHDDDGALRHYLRIVENAAVARLPNSENRLAKFFSELNTYGASLHGANRVRVARDLRFSAIEMYFSEPHLKSTMREDIDMMSTNAPPSSELPSHPPQEPVYQPTNVEIDDQRKTIEIDDQRKTIEIDDQRKTIEIDDQRKTIEIDWTAVASPRRLSMSAADVAAGREAVVASDYGPEPLIPEVLEAELAADCLSGFLGESGKRTSWCPRLRVVILCPKISCKLPAPIDEAIMVLLSAAPLVSTIRAQTSFMRPFEQCGGAVRAPDGRVMQVVGLRQGIAPPWLSEHRDRVAALAWHSGEHRFAIQADGSFLGPLAGDGGPIIESADLTKRSGSDFRSSAPISWNKLGIEHAVLGRFLDTFLDDIEREVMQLGTLGDDLRISLVQVQMDERLTGVRVLSRLAAITEEESGPQLISSVAMILRMCPISIHGMTELYRSLFAVAVSPFLENLDSEWNHSCGDILERVVVKFIHGVTSSRGGTTSGEPGDLEWLGSRQAIGTAALSRQTSELLLQTCEWLLVSNHVRQRPRRPKKVIVGDLDLEPTMSWSTAKNIIQNKSSIHVPRGRLPMVLDSLIHSILESWLRSSIPQVSKGFQIRFDPGGALEAFASRLLFLDSSKVDLLLRDSDLLRSPADVVSLTAPGIYSSKRNLQMVLDNWADGTVTESRSRLKLSDLVALKAKATTVANPRVVHCISWSSVEKPPTVSRIIMSPALLRPYFRTSKRILELRVLIDVSQREALAPKRRLLNEVLGSAAADEDEVPYNDLRISQRLATSVLRLLSTILMVIYDDIIAVEQADWKRTPGAQSPVQLRDLHEAWIIFIDAEVSALWGVIRRPLELAWVISDLIRSPTGRSIELLEQRARWDEAVLCLLDDTEAIGRPLSDRVDINSYYRVHSAAVNERESILNKLILSSTFSSSKREREYPEWVIYSGRDKYENEALIRYGHEEDLWFHIDNLSSSHVYVRVPTSVCPYGSTPNKEMLPDRIVKYCCQITKHNSIKGCKQVVDIVVTPWSNLKKDPDMDVGQIAFHVKEKRDIIQNVSKIQELVKLSERIKTEEEVDFAKARDERDGLAHAEDQRRKKAAAAEVKEARKRDIEVAKLRSYSAIHDAGAYDSRRIYNEAQDLTIEQIREVEEDFM